LEAGGLPDPDRLFELAACHKLWFVVDPNELHQRVIHHEPLERLNPKARAPA
jgi:hypothetical protein